MSDPRFRVTSDPLDVSAVAAILSSADCGAVATFVGLVRNENGGRRVLWLDYEAYEPLAVKTVVRNDEGTRGTRPPIPPAVFYPGRRPHVGGSNRRVPAAAPPPAPAIRAGPD